LEVPQKEVSRTTLTLGTPLMMRLSSIKEKILSPNQAQEENPSNQETLLSSFLEDTEEEELSFLNPSHLEIS
jgi:hypothetical protein